MNKKKIYGLVAFLVILAALVVGQTLLTRAAAQTAQRSAQAPIFQVDPMWPKPLPNAWVIGSTIGVAVDAQDHIWMLHRPSTLAKNEINMQPNPPLAEYCCKIAPPVLEFDQAGNLVSSWGGKGVGYDWPGGEHAIFVDHKDNVWVGKQYTGQMARS